MATSLTAIIHNNMYCVNIWDTSILNTILYTGNLYSFISTSVHKDLLLLIDVPEMVSADDKVYCLQYSESFSGGLFLTANSGPYVPLKHAFNQIFSSSLLNFRTALRTIGSNTVAIFRPSMLTQSFKVLCLLS